MDTPGNLAASSGVLQVGDVILKVNGHVAIGHDLVTEDLRNAVGDIAIEIYSEPFWSVPRGVFLCFSGECVFGDFFLFRA